MENHLKHLFNSLFILLVLGLSSCDFTSGLNQDILTAQKLVDQQDFDKAVEIYERVLKKNPSKNELKQLIEKIQKTFSSIRNEINQKLSQVSQNPK